MECDPQSVMYHHVIDECIEVLFAKFVKPDCEALLETVNVNGSILDNPEGRTINPGHAIETAWFLMQEALRRGNNEIMFKALDILKWSFKRGWDSEYGGLFNFTDLDGKPPEKVEWSMKYWWPHNEALYAALLAYHITQDDYYAETFEKTYDFAMHCFPDAQFGEWYGYLNRDGSVCLPIKGSMFKGPFHLPRQLLFSIQLLDKMI